jgi:hypothetical protein
VLINIYETGECPKDDTQIKIIVLNKKPKATKYSEICTISLIPYTAKIVARILRTRVE